MLQLKYSPLQQLKISDNDLVSSVSLAPDGTFFLSTIFIVTGYSPVKTHPEMENKTSVLLKELN